MKTFLKIISIFFALIFAFLLFLLVKDCMRTESQIINSNWKVQLPKDLKVDYEFFESPEQDGKIYRVFSIEDKDADKFATWKKGPSSSAEAGAGKLIEYLNIQKDYRISFADDYFYYKKTDPPKTDGLEEENMAYEELYMFYFPSQKKLYVIEDLM